MWHNVRLLNAIASALVALVVLAALVAGGHWLIQRPIFTLKAIQIDGDVSHLNGPTLRANAVSRLKGNFFTIDLDATRAAFEAVPWVRHASVRRVWPNQLAITIEEYKPLATWNDGRLVSVDGELFAANLAEAEDEGKLPEFAGPPGSEKDVTARYYDFVKWFAPLNMKPEAVALSNRYAWGVRLAGGVQLALGRERTPETLATRSRRFVQAYPQVAARWGNQIEYADLRYPNGFAVRAAGMRFLSEEQAKKLAATPAQNRDSRKPAVAQPAARQKRSQ
ncbi:cell division protein FtsQ/DivIB [Pandoraea communis]|uniref:Cell division protein FtsQ n=1 Tax=Pandoraea communis TaxID=2508297 RepID=A0A5E4WD63_9BURK|nr:cell division protein FtsQ/DivIB [Pandoraea communis]MDM8357865.1 cell division protein FtsQ/DivIB [Pandoraea communis]VVE20985.1 cell division protein FtsQ [Pandoraea communis]